MPAIVTDFGIAMIRLISMTQAATAPQLDEPELTNLLADAQRASIWTAELEYDYGAIIIPTVANRTGHRYKVVAFDGTGRTSGTTEPSWIRWRYNPMSRGELVSDGNITWQEDGPDYDSLWDLQMAAYQGWLLKAAKASQCVDHSEDGQSFKESQSYDHCIEQARRYAPVMC